MNKERKLIDIDDLQIDVNRPKQERIEQFVGHSKNPFNFLCQGYEVEISFGDSDLQYEDCLLGIFL